MGSGAAQQCPPGQHVGLQAPCPKQHDSAVLRHAGICTRPVSPPTSPQCLNSACLQDARGQSDSTLLQSRVQEYDAELESYIPVLMAQAHIYWEMGHYSQVIRVLNQSREFAGEHDTWKLNVAHTYFMMVRIGLASCKLQVATDIVIPVSATVTVSTTVIPCMCKDISRVSRFTSLPGAYTSGRGSAGVARAHVDLKPAPAAAV